MRGASTRRAFLVTALSASALSAASCGDDGDDSATTPASAPPAKERERLSGERSTAQKDQGEGERGATPQSESRGNDSSAGFVPKSHQDSGGGSEQFRLPGGDNSVQDYGSEAEGSEFEQAAAALHAFYDARAAGKWAAACEYLVAGLAASLEGRSSPSEGDDTSCASGLELMTNPTATKQIREEAREIDVGSFRAEGDSGFLLYRDGQGTPYAIAVAKEEGEWKVANLVGLPLT